jgi:hypothetical protein
LTSDASGGASWQPLAEPNTPVWVSVSGTQPVGTNLTFNFTTESADRGGNFDMTTDQFVVPTSGIYLLNLSDAIGNDTNDYSAHGALKRSTGEGLLSGSFAMRVPAGQANTATITSISYLLAGQQIEYEASCNAGNQPRQRTVQLQIVKLSN